MQNRNTMNASRSATVHWVVK